MAVGTFEYFTNGKWYATGTGGDPTLFDIDTNEGMRIDLTLTGVDTFNLEMTPLNDPSIAYTKSGTLDGPAGRTIDWVEFELYNTDSDYYPTHTITGGETDFYISYMQILPVPEPTTGAVLLAAAGPLASVAHDPSAGADVGLTGHEPARTADDHDDDDGAARATSRGLKPFVHCVQSTCNRRGFAPAAAFVH